MIIDIEQIYSDFIQERNTLNRQEYKEKYKGWFSASSAGSCFNKQILRLHQKEGPSPQGRVLRLLRLGTIVHKDFETAINKYHDDNPEINIYTEHKVELPEINVVGHLDIAVEKDNSLDVYDIKTCASYKWRKQFGLIKNRDKNPSVNYELQIGTYAIGMANQIGIDPDKIFMYLAWYNKDNSGMKVKEVPVFWMDNAFEYWTDLIDAQSKTGDNPDELIPGTPNVPVANWECKYCEFQGLYCEGVPSNRK